MLTRLTVLFVFLTTPAFAQSEKKVTPLPDSIEALRDIEYAKPNGVPLQLDIFRPKESHGRSPVIIFVHGGGWKNGSRSSGEKNAAWLAAEGFSVVSISYRLTDIAEWPAQIDDCYEAVRWVRRNANKYNFDADHIAAWGTSAGGHLVALMGTRPCPHDEDVSSRVQAVCDWFGPSELLTMPPNNVGDGRTEADVANSNGAKLLGATVRNVPQKANDASGVQHVTADDCPFLIMHGSEDPGVPLSQSQNLHDKLAAVGVETTLHVVEGAGHGGKLFQTPEVKRVVLTFFTRRLKHNWPQGAGPNVDYHSNTTAPTEWSVTQDENIRWKKTLPETGQSTIAVWGNRLFFTTMKAVTANSELGSDIVAWCCDARTGDTLWQKPIAASHPLRLSGCFSDSSAPSPVTDGQHVCFFNASGRISCFDFDGNELWSQEFMPVGRTQPFLANGSVVFIRQMYMPDDQGHFTHEHKNAPPEQWTNLQALDMASGKIAWTSQCGVNMGCIPLPATLGDGSEVVLLGRGGGHSPPERPEGVSMISALDGSTIWTLPIPGYMSTQTFSVHSDQALIFHRDQHLWVDCNTGKVTKQISITEDVNVRAFADGQYVDRKETIEANKSRNIIQQSNLLVGDYHYFRSYMQPYIGRIHAVTGTLEYLQVPVQTRYRHDGTLDRLWDESQLTTPIPTDKRKRPFGVGTPVSYVAYELNDVRNSRGFIVMGDARSQANGWGHHAAAIPAAAGGQLYMPIMSGLVYVLNSGADKFDESALTAINDLGATNKTWTRSSLSFANGHVYARTIKELLCIGK